jgi:hypothetical protein
MVEACRQGFEGLARQQACNACRRLRRQLQLTVKIEDGDIVWTTHCFLAIDPQLKAALSIDHNHDLVVATSGNLVGASTEMSG